MKKLFIVVVLILVSLVFANGQSFAITGACSGCHTMHNSQNGTVVAAGTTYGQPAYGQLLLGDCLACHTKLGGAAPTAPKVDTDVAGSMTASGSWNLNTLADTNQHNISVIGVLSFGNPEGTNSTGVAPGGTFTAANLTCAGANGCHGSGNVAYNAAIPTGQNGLNGYHHNSIAGGAGYRFLRVRGDNNPAVLGTGVGGSGSTDWEMGGATATNHNVYMGKAYNAALGNSFSDFCNNCHPTFHAAGDAATDQGGATGAFTRHPTDRQISGVLAGAITVDYNANPFVWSDTTGISSTAAYTVTAAAEVGCVSCHRSHASDQPDLLRFDYATQQAGNGTSTVGCLGCHVSQR